MKLMISIILISILQSALPDPCLGCVDPYCYPVAPGGNNQLNQLCYLGNESAGYRVLMLEQLVGYDGPIGYIPTIWEFKFDSSFNQPWLEYHD